MNRVPALLMGQQLGTEYRLVRPRGRGGFGLVWEAETRDGTMVALKFLPCANSRRAAQEIRSIQVIRQLQHPNLTPIHQVWCYQGYVVVTMELADGNMADLLKQHQEMYGTPPPPDLICSSLLQVAEALDFLNCRQHLLDGQRIAVQHGDVKPSNLLIYGNLVKLCDYGMASVTTSKERTHRRAGTLDYAAPEVFLGRQSNRTDQYALAVTYCVLRSGQLPYPHTPRKFDPHLVRSEVDCSMLTPDERPIIARALSRVPQDRWPTCVEMISALTLATGDVNPLDQASRPTESSACV